MGGRSQPEAAPAARQDLLGFEPTHIGVKQVRALEIVALDDLSLGYLDVRMPDGSVRQVDVPRDLARRGTPVPGDRLIIYRDGYVSWCPKAVFEGGEYRAVGAEASSGGRTFRPTHINADHLVEAYPIAAAEFEADGSGRVGYMDPAGGLVIVPVPPGFLRRPGSVSEGDMLVRYEPTKTEPAGRLSSSPSAAFEAVYQAFRDGSGKVAPPLLAGLSWRAVIEAEQRANAYASGSAPKSCGLTFGEALEALKAGARICRAGWNGKSMWLALSGPLNGREIPAESFWSLHNAEFALRNGGSATVLPCITMKTATGEILMGWLASQTDMLAEDWMLVEHGGASIAEEPRVPRFEGADSVQVVPPAA